ncbi:uncharacterized protein LOC125876816 [Solanum stenotomum]|uniref:uncharacterized protein LOC125876816 n=1 Tax=Solanum stenotomum TaxID=172797 RepID=UPI0020D1AFC6|nr:uncharacterized protein LOC125876816 [Solanum stenotomum]
MGLNDSYCGARDNILMISPLPTIANAYALLMQEEKQREMHSTAKYPGESSAFIVAEQDMNGQRPSGNNFRGQRYAVDNKKFDNTCKYCKKPGHIVDKCYKLKGFPPNFKFTKQRNFQNPVQGNFACSNEANGEKFLYNVDNGDKGKLLTQDQLNQIVQMLHQVKIGEQSSDSTAIASGNCAGPFNEEPHGPW